jgi:glycosyltransferase involved in cell wall biosynthesis
MTGQPAGDPTISVIVCAHNEARYLAACLHSLLAQTRPPDELLVINNASTDATRAVAQQIPNVRVVDEPRKGWWWRVKQGAVRPEAVFSSTSTRTAVRR